MTNATDQIIPLPCLYLPRNYAWETGLVEEIEAHFRKIGRPRRYTPPRFIGYYFNYTRPIALCHGVRVALPLRPPIEFLDIQVEAVTGGLHSIVAAWGDAEPAYLLIHDAWDGTCCLRPFAPGSRFVAANLSVKG